MSAAYRAVKWNRAKIRYDLVVALAAALFLVGFVGVGLLAWPGDAMPTLLIRATAFTAFALLTVALLIGPAARLDPRLTPLLYNRRHLGVVVCVLALAHAALVTLVYHGFGERWAIASVLDSALAFGSSPTVAPFEFFGLLALIVLVLMAATSHDFWLRTLTPRVWKALHMLVYPAYAAIIAHVALGFLLDERDPALFAVVAIAVALVVSVHITSGVVQMRRDARSAREAHNDAIDACAATDIALRRAQIVRARDGAPIAVFRVAPGETADCFRALSNVCAHQGGPLGEGRVLDGCATCPWHGFQFDADSGRAPAPYTDRVPVYAVSVREGRVFVSARPKGGRA